MCTPGRILHHLDENSTFNLDSLQILVLDEADRYFFVHKKYLIPVFRLHNNHHNFSNYTYKLNWLLFSKNLTNFSLLSISSLFLTTIPKILTIIGILFSCLLQISKYFSPLRLIPLK